MHTARLKLLLVSLTLNSLCASADVWDFIFGPKLKSYGSRSSSVETENSTRDHVEELTRKYQYPLEKHQVITSQGYILTLHRLPFGRKINRTKRSRPVVLLHLGFFGSPECFLFRGPQNDLPYILADSGYDTWILNNRGSTYSRKHLKLNPEYDKSFWEFSFHELGVYDLPTVIDYILNITSRKDLFFIGYSMGAAVGYILCSSKPDYNSKIRHFINLAPTADVVHKLTPAHSMIFSVMPNLIENLDKQNISEVFPRRSVTAELLTNVCQSGSALQQMCMSVIFLLVGADYKQLDPDLFAHIFKYFPDGSSLKTLDHYAQVMISGVFRQYDYGPERNKLIYDNVTPPRYNLSKVTAPTSIYYGAGDFLVTEADCEYLAKQLPNLMGLYKVPLKDFNHMDFMWATDVRQLLYDPLVHLLNKYK